MGFRQPTGREEEMLSRAEKGYTMRRCRRCGFPRAISFAIRWGANGTITPVFSKDFRVAIIHHGFIDSLLSSIEAKLGLSIEHIAFEAQLNASRATFDTVGDKVPGLRLAGRLKLVRRIGGEVFHRVAVYTGMCRSWTVEYIPGERGTAVIKNPFNIGLMAANVVGAFEALERIPFSQTWEEESKDSYVIRIEATGEKPEIAERMKVEFSEALPGNIHFDRCPRCKVPWAMANSLKWIESEGTIVDMRTGARVIFLDAYMVTTVLREMASELGDEIYDLVVEAQRDWTTDHVAELGLSGGNGPLSPAELEAAYRDYLEMLPLYGYGNPVSFNMSESTVQVVVENPYEPSILAGTFQGLFEALEKRKSSVSWEKPRRGAVSFTIAPVD